MIYLITNIYCNNNVYNIELRNQELEKIFIKSTNKHLTYQVGNFVEVTKLSGKSTIEKQTNTPENYLDFYKKGTKEYQQLYDELLNYYEKVTIEEYKILLDETIFKNLDFFKYPAAKSIHHDYIGGLAEHTLNLLNLSQELIKMYDLDQDLLWTGIMLHDYSKLKEMSHFGLTYTVEGNLIGHLVMTVEEIVKVCGKYNIENTLEIITLKHLILAHHGKLEYGSAKEPMTKEAYALSQLDELDAKMNVLQKAIDQVPDNTMTASILAFDRRRFLNYKKEED
ncbi:MAG: HD domain-containing protein [Mycoplasmatales bacterium]